MAYNEEYEHNGDWDSWRRYVIETLRTMHEEQKQLEEDLARLNVELQVLSVKAGLWGSLAGVIVGAVMLVADYFLRK